MTDSLILLLWNVYVGNTALRVRLTLGRWLKKRKPDVVVLNEAMRFHSTISRVAERRGYVMLAQTPESRNQNPRPERGNTVMLVRDNDLHLRDSDFWPMDEDWMVWSHRQKHDPRIQVVARLRGRGGRWAVMGDHWATAGNTRAQQESIDFTRDFLEGPGVRIALGDKNVKEKDLRRLFPRAMVAGHNVDGVIVTGATAVFVEKLGKGGGDHHAIEVEVVR